MKTKHLFFAFLACLLASTSCNCVEPEKNNVIENIYSSTPIDLVVGKANINKNCINKNSLFVKSLYSDDYLKSVFPCIKDILPIAKTKLSSWKKITLQDDLDSYFEIDKFRKSNLFDTVDFDYIYSSTVVEQKDAILPDPSNVQPFITSINGEKAWSMLKDNGINPGGSSDVIVAVLDTGIDYNHIDLAPNMWKNVDEIPNNNVDDDNNGYVDDYYGYNAIENSDCKDINGHGTHVAGIIAASNDNRGITGIAYNCKLMNVMVANQYGQLYMSDIIEGLEYAYINGADIINMSFSSNTFSIPFRDLLMEISHDCVLVASAGNEALANELLPGYGDLFGVSYPAAFPFVIGVMSCNNQYRESNFTNFDVKPNNDVEYEVYAPGENIVSTYPNGEYMSMSGTSMSCPVVSGIAALLRSKYSNKNVYSSKFIASQIINSSNIQPTITHNIYRKPHDNEAVVVDAYAALSKISKPRLSLANKYFIDSKKISPSNNGDGIVNLNETIRIAIDINNNGGKATNVVAKISSKDSFVTIIKDNINVPNIGMYSQSKASLEYDGDNLINASEYFEIKIKPDCYTNASIYLNLEFSCDENTITNHTINVKVDSGIHLPKQIDSDLTLFSNNKYIIDHDVNIPKGVTVTVQPNVEIQYYSTSFNNQFNKKCPDIIVFGTINFNGIRDGRIKIYPHEDFINYACLMSIYETGTINFNYVDCINHINFMEKNGEPSYKAKNINTEINANYSTFTYQGDLVIKGPGSGDINTKALNLNDVQNSFIDCTSGGRVDFMVYGNANKNWFNCQNATIIPVKNSTFENNIISNISNSESDDLSPQLFFTNLSHDIIRRNNIIFYSNVNKENLGDYNIKLEPFTGKGPIEFCNTEFLNLPDEYIKNVVEGYAIGDFVFKDMHKLDSSTIYPYIKNISCIDASGDPINYVGQETVQIKVEFNIAMDTSKEVSVTFGSIKPYNSYLVDGIFTDSKTWVGEYTFTPYTGDGNYFFNVFGAYSADNLPAANTSSMFSFTLNTSSVQFRTLQGIATKDGIRLNWFQDEQEDLMGYNIYRSSDENGYYDKINKAVIPASITTYLDQNVLNAKSYWYMFTIVDSDMHESEKLSKINVISYDNSDSSAILNVMPNAVMGETFTFTIDTNNGSKISKVNLYYRIKGNFEYTRVTMNKSGQKFTYNLYIDKSFINDIEYFVVAESNFDSIYLGGENDPYILKIKNSLPDKAKGDVDGNGKINLADAIAIKNHIDGKSTINGEQFYAADIDNDNNLTNADINLILQYLNGKILSLEGIINEK